MPRTFSESWHRVAEQRLSLRPNVLSHRQFFRGEKWYVLQDSYNNQFFRLRPAAYEFVVRLTPKRTVREVWLEVVEQFPEDAPGQEDVIQLLAQLYHANLLLYDAPADSRELFERYRKRRQRELQSRLLSVMFARIPLLDPDDLLRALRPFAAPFVGPLGWLLWFVVVGGAGKVAIDRWDLLQEQSQAILAPGNLALLYVALALTKTLHEFGHAIVCRHYGGEVHTMGVMLLVFTPIPYMDASSSWAFSNRWRRIYVGAAGMIVEIFVAALAVFVWANTAPGALHGLAYNMIFIASVSTVLFNVNPLLRFDGYYILSDLLDVPNLHQQGRRHLVHLVERYAFGCERSESPAESWREKCWLTVFGILSGIYRVVVFTGIILFVADRFLLAGLLMAAVCLISWGVVPTVRLCKYLSSSPKLERTRARAVTVCVGVALLAVWGLSVIPAPARFRAPGVVQARRHMMVVPATPGQLETILADSGQAVAADQPLFQLRNRELELELAGLQARLEQTQLRWRQALQLAAADIAALDEQRATLESQVADLEGRLAALLVRAPFAGRWSAPEFHQYVGAHLPRGAAVGQLIDASSYRFAAVVSQSEASHLFGERSFPASVRLHGQAACLLPVRSSQIVPGGQRRLPSAAVGWAAGGDVATELSDASGMTAAEEFFVVLAELDPLPAASLRHGLTGKVRFELPPQPLLTQWWRKLRQLLQERYGL